VSHTLRSILRLLLAAVAAGLAMNVGMVLFFGPAQALLTDPGLQSEKFLAAFTEAPLPRVAEAPWLLPVGLLALGLPHAAAFHLVRRGLPQGWPSAGATYGFVAWLVAYPWFEYYLPWNVMREPLPLVLLELACWLGVMLCNGLALGLVFRRVMADRGDQGP
jgi:hypothetical protein